MPTFRRIAYSFARVAQLTVTNFIKDRCSWRASALTYITVLSLVPMLALGFSVAKGMGAYDRLLNHSIEPFLDSTFGSADGAPIDVAGLEIDDASQDGVGSVEDDTADGSSEPATGRTETEDGAPVRSDSGESGEAAAMPEAGTEEDTDGATEGTADDEDQVALENAVVASDTVGDAAGSEVRRAIDTVLGFVQRTDVSRLGALGFLIVLYTVIKLLGAVEVSFNDIWGVRKSRSLPRKLADYLSTIVLVPILLVTGTGVMSLARNETFERWIGAGAESPLFAFFSSMVVVWVGFAFAYILMPNTRVRVSSAMVGGIVGGTMWQIFQWAHLKLQVGVANYNAIYSTFAALPIFLFWVQSSWMTVLFGAEAAAAHQNQARHGQLVRSRDYDMALKEVVALRLVARVAAAFLDGAPPSRVEELADELGCPERTLIEVANGLEHGRIVAMVDLEGDEDDPALILASDPDIVRVQDVLDALKGDSLQEVRETEEVEGDPIDLATDRVFARFRTARDGTDANITLRQLATARDHSFAATA